MNITVVSATGSNGRSEDRAVVFEHGDAFIVVVADGAGGVRGGAAAADAVVSAVHAILSAEAFDPFDVHVWARMLERVDKDLARMRGGETTAIIVAVGNGALAGVSAGDSEAWVISDHEVDRLTERQGRKRVGSGEARPTSFYRKGIDGVLVIGTDGLFKYVHADVIASHCHAGATVETADKLVAATKLVSGSHQDDVAVVLATDR
jgi:serine/threonine protein phosphatase PrpC